MKATPVFAAERRVGAVDQLCYGTSEIGKPRWSGGSWYRVDLYRSTERGEAVSERHFAADSEDYSPTFYRDVNGKYDANCACCYLNFPHTISEHDKAVKAHAKAVTEHAAKAKPAR